MNSSLEAVGKGAPIMDFLCTVCGKREEEPQGWRLVLELDKPGTAIRNTLFILDEWDGKKASEPNASCFCSADCEESYLAARHRQLVA
jgi:hypothetical protein